MSSKNLLSGKSEYTRSYSNLKGVVIGCGCEPDTHHLAYCENMYRDYESGGAGVIESVPGFRQLLSLGDRIYGIFKHRCLSGTDYILVHAGSCLYRFPLSEKDSTPKAAQIGELKAVRSRGFSFGGYYYILDGERILRISEDGTVLQVGSEELEGYVPTTYYNGTPLEQRNLLTDKFIEEQYVSDAARFGLATDELAYTVLNTDTKTCAVSGVSSSFSGELHIPGYVKIGNVEYKVTEIANSAFAYNQKISSVKIHEGVERIGRFAFMEVAALKSIVMPSSLGIIDTGAFLNCVLLEEVYFGDGLREIKGSAFSGCAALNKIHYPLSKSDLAEVNGSDTITEANVSFFSKSTEACTLIPIHSDAISILSVEADGIAAEYETVSSDGRINGVIIHTDTPDALNRKTVKIHGIQRPLYSTFDNRTQSEENKQHSLRAILGCTLCEIFDGRLFLSGNPSLPNTVFYSARSEGADGVPLYFGAYDYFADGIGSAPIISMLAVRDSLAVFKSKDDGSGSIFYHFAQDTTDSLMPKIYPVSYVHREICATGDSICFLDDPLFLSPIGLAALEKQQINYDRSVVSRSRNVNFDLLKENLSSAYLVPWMGYLAVCVGSRIYLADSRALFTDSMGVREYEWFVLKDIGVYEGATRMYRYSANAAVGLTIHPTKLDEPCSSTVYTYSEIGYGLLHYSIEDGVKYALYATEQMWGGSFSPAVCYFADGELLLFGTESGRVCIFNNDKRGIPPATLANDTDFDAAEYAESMGRRIHPYYYSFNNRRVRYAIKTRLDDCGIPHLTKDTSKHSLVIKCKSYSPGILHCEVGTDTSGYSEVAYFSGGALNFSDIDFTSLSLASAEEHFTIPIAEKEKNWVEKQITLYSDSFRCPIAISSITFRYSVKGKIKG